jgi:hypothetical protein
MTKKGKVIPRKSAWTVQKKKLIVLSLICIASLAVGSILFFFLRQSSAVFSLNAVIIDQLSEDFSNPTFVENITATLENYDFNVTYYNYTRTDVEFFKGLAKGNYGIIILRVHSALRENAPIVDFFTSERFSEQKRYGEYSRDCDEGLLVKGILNYSGIVKEYFAITPKFVERYGVFPKSIVIAMGCWGFNSSLRQMAEAFQHKGAIAYVGWSGMVTVSHTDNETAKLMWRLLFENKTLDEAVNKAKRDMETGSFLRYYPESTANLKLYDLIKEAKASGASASLTTFGYHGSPILIIDRPQCILKRSLHTKP